MDNENKDIHSVQTLNESGRLTLISGASKSKEATPDQNEEEVQVVVLGSINRIK